MDGSVATQDGKLGRIVAVSGAQVVVLLQGETAGTGETQRKLQIGALAKVVVPGFTVFGIVGGLDVPVPAHDSATAEIGLAEIELLGECFIEGAGNLSAFRRGISVMPSLGDEVFTANQADLSLVYSASPETSVRVGSVHQDRNLPACVITDDLLGKHFAILGSTGTGKSCAVALILRAILSRFKHGHILLLDMHSEYASAFGDMAEVLDSTTLKLPYWLLNFEEFEEIVLGRENNDRETMAAIFSEVIVAAKKILLTDSDLRERVTPDMPVPYRLGDIVHLIDEEVGRLDKTLESTPYLRLKSLIESLQNDSRFGFMFPGIGVHDNMVAILSQFFRVPVAGKPITILDLSGVPSEILNVVVSVLCRMTFEFSLWSDRAMPVMLVCEEAHRYAPREVDRGFEPTKLALSRIAKEGRKYGISLCIVSQRPSELASEILSQCNTIFAMRMSNQKDQAFVHGTLADSALRLLDVLPSLGNGEAIAIGEGVPVPVRICFDKIPEDQRPRSGTASFSKAWSEDEKDEKFTETVVARWRNQGR